MLWGGAVSNPLNEMLVGLRIEWRGVRSQGGRGKRGICRVLGVCKMRKWINGRSGGGVKKKWVGGSSFSQAPLGFRTVCEMTLGVWNYFAYPFRFRIVCEIGLGVWNFLYGLRKFRRVCEISHPMRIDSLISHALQKFRIVCELFFLFLCLKSPCNRS